MRKLYRRHQNHDIGTEQVRRCSPVGRPAGLVWLLAKVNDSKVVSGRMVDGTSLVGDLGITKVLPNSLDALALAFPFSSSFSSTRLRFFDIWLSGDDQSLSNGPYGRAGEESAVFVSSWNAFRWVGIAGKIECVA